MLHPELELIGSIADLDLVVSFSDFAEALKMDIVCAVCYVEFVVFILALNFAFGFSPDSVSFSETEDMPNNDGSKSRFIKVKIRDFGPGVSEEDIPIIMEKFARGKNAEDKSGYGLGLFLVKFYMEKQGGGMNYYNDNGFVVELLVRKV